MVADRGIVLGAYCNFAKCTTFLDATEAAIPGGGLGRRFISVFRAFAAVSTVSVNAFWRGCDGSDVGRRDRKSKLDVSGVKGAAGVNCAGSG